MAVFFDYLQGVTFGAFTMWTFDFYCSIFLVRKKEWRLSWIILILLVTGAVRNQIGIFLNTNFPIYSFIRALLALSNTYIVIAIVLLSFYGNMRKKFFLAVLFFIPIFTSEILASSFMLSIYQTNMGDITLESELFSLINILAGVLCFMFVVVIRITYRKFDFKVVATRTYPLELTVPILSMIACSYLLQFGSYIFSYIGLIFLAINVIALLVYIRQELYYKQNQKYALQRQLDSFRDAHYRELEAHQNEIRAIRHDIKNQLIVMNAYMKSGLIERAGEQINTLIEQLYENEGYFFTEHVGINGLLTAVCKKAQEAGITCEFDINLPREIEIEDTDFAALLGNILDNALEACYHCDSASYIRLDMVKRNNVVVLWCENSIDGQAMTLSTRKKDYTNHGIGMKIIRRIVEKYSGDLQYRFEDQRFVLEFTLFL
ncbi:sensor histidine kinase [Enterococcus sp. LJL128]|uniref:sensor histidine kinase n=1 Tax=Enterococcus sp. LJL51 TaxID=3416656 RepID=UPI003CF51C62